MKVPVCIVFLMCGVLIFQIPTTCATYANTHRLLDDLIKGHNHNVRPNADLRGPVVVNFGISINNLLIEDSDQGFVKAHGLLDLSWPDKRLAWDPLEYGNISMMRISSDRIWLPDIQLYNSLDARNDMYAEEKPLAIVTSKGNVQYVPPVTLALDCIVTENMERRTEVSCRAKFGSWSYDGWNIDFKADNNQIDASNNAGERFQLIESNVTREYVTYSCCPEPYPSIIATFKAKQMY